MTRLLLLFLLPLAALGQTPAYTPASVNAGYTYVTGTNVSDSAGYPLASGRITFTPTDASGNLKSVKVGGGGQVTTAGGSAQVQNGAFALYLVDVSKASPAYFCYRVTITDNATGNQVIGGQDYACLQPTGASYNFDNYASSSVPITQMLVNAFSGNLTLNGNLTVTGNISGNWGSSPTGTYNFGTVNANVMNLQGLPVATQTQLAVAANAASAGSLGMSADGTMGSDDSITDNWYADFSCNGALPAGFDEGANYYCQQSHWNAATAAQANLVRSVMFSGGGYVPSAVSWTIQARMEYAGGSNVGNFIGFNTAPAKTYDTTGKNTMKVGFTNQGLVFVNQGVSTLLLPNTGAFSPTAQTTDSGWTGPDSTYPGAQSVSGWAAPGAGWYDVSLMYTNNATKDILVSMVALGGVQQSFSFRIPNQTGPICASPCGNLGGAAGIQNLQLESSSIADEQALVAYSMGGPRSVTLNIPHRNGYYNPGMLVRFPVAHNTWAWIPPSYDRAKLNKWVIQFHGCCSNGQDIQRQYTPVSTYLYQQGYVIVSVDNSVGPNPWGNYSSLVDAQNAVNAVMPMLSLDAHPYAMCDSMGCLQMLNAISQGFIHPRAAVGFSPNTNAAWGWGGAAYGTTPGSGPDASVFTAAYNITPQNPQATAMAGYDPMLVPVATYLPVPMRMFCATTDTVVNCSQNGAALMNRLAAVGGDDVWIPTSGDHEDASNFSGPAVTAFFNSH